MPRHRSGVPDLFDPSAFQEQFGRRVQEPVPVRKKEEAPGESPASATTIGELTQTARDVIEGAFPPLWVRGEVTDFKAHRNGHWYFCLRDESAQIRCVVWSRDAVRIVGVPADGMQVVARGQLTVYPARGEMQFAVTAIEAVGDGARRAAVERTLRALDRDGLLAPERKRALPAFPRRVAVVTSPDGAAVRDIIAVTKRRAPSVEIIVVAARVQGEGAPQALCAALAAVGRWGAADLVIIGRGGGGREDLWAFDDERVARAVAACRAPTISAVGHEVDLTVCDLVADLRAPTPSAAAEAAVPVEDAVRGRVRELGEALQVAAVERVRRAHDGLTRSARAVRVAALRDGERRVGRVQAAAARLHALSPMATLARGYAVAREIGGGATKGSVADFAGGERFELLLRDGTVQARVEPQE
jgi:exodeoxyribonuclease VII large subunit